MPELGSLGSVRGRSAMRVPTANIPTGIQDPMGSTKKLEPSGIISTFGPCSPLAMLRKEIGKIRGSITPAMLRKSGQMGLIETIAALHWLRARARRRGRARLATIPAG